MTLTFDPNGRVVAVRVYLAGPRGAEYFRFAVDTAATRSAVSALVLEQLGYLASQRHGQYQVRTGSGGTRTGLVTIQRFAAFGRIRDDFPVLWLPLPPASRIDGLIGLDFFRDLVLTIDFLRGRISLNQHRRWWQFWR
jgi:hypothetical protein